MGKMGEMGGKKQPKLSVSFFFFLKYIFFKKQHMIVMLMSEPGKLAVFFFFLSRFWMFLKFFIFGVGLKDMRHLERLS